MVLGHFRKYPEIARVVSYVWKCYQLSTFQLLVATMGTFLVQMCLYVAIYIV
jgi:hypothetical protein